MTATSVIKTKLRVRVNNFNFPQWLLNIWFRQQEKNTCVPNTTYFSNKYFPLTIILVNAMLVSLS